MHHLTDRIAHTTAFVTPVVEHWLEREIAQWVHPMKDRSDDPSHHERTLLPRSYISLPASLKYYHCTTAEETDDLSRVNYVVNIWQYANDHRWCRKWTEESVLCKAPFIYGYTSCEIIS